MKNDLAAHDGHRREFVTPETQESAHLVTKIVYNLLKSLEEKGISYCHWKSNVRLEETLAGTQDIDILVDRAHAGLFHTTLLDNGFKLAQSRSGVGHPGVFHALGLDGETTELVDLHAYYQLVSGDSLVKNYRLPVEDRLLGRTRRLHGIKVPTPEAELVLFALRIALKHVSLIEILKANVRYRKVSGELAWLREVADVDEAAALCTAWFPTVEPALFRRLLDVIAEDRAIVRRVVIGWQVARRLSGLRRLGPVLGATSRLWRLWSFVVGRVRCRQDLALQTGGIIVALVGPKATGKSTIGRELSARLGRHLNVCQIHAGKPPATVLSLMPRLFVPIARWLLPNERLAEYEKPERRLARRYSLLYVLRMTLLAHERRKLLRRALREATAGAIVVSDRYPSETIGAIDSCCFDDAAMTKCGSPLKRWLMARERAFYQALPRPHLVLRLEAPMDTALQRDARRGKQGGPDAQAVRRRWELESRAEFPGTPVIHIDTGQPLGETIRTVVRAVWAAL